jgi:hypothetical protein
VTRMRISPDATAHVDAARSMDAESTPEPHTLLHVCDAVSLFSDGFRLKAFDHNNRWYLKLSRQRSVISRDGFYASSFAIATPFPNDSHLLSAHRGIDRKPFETET